MTRFYLNSADIADLVYVPRNSKSKGLTLLAKMTAVSDVPAVTGKKIAAGARHRLFLRAIVLLQKIYG